MSTIYTDRIAPGQRVHCILHGGKTGTVVTVHGPQLPGTCRNSGIIVTGGRAEFDIVWDGGATSRVPEALVRSSVQWRVLDQVVSSEGVAAAQAQAALHKADVKARQDYAADQRAKLRVRYLAENPHLTPVAAHKGRGNLAAINIRKALKRAFPGTKFRVVSDHNSVNVSWVDGPNTAAVEDVTHTYKEGHFDGMTDCYSYATTAWHDVFGGSQYIFTRREFSDATIAAAIDEVCPGRTVAEFRAGKLWANDVQHHIYRWLETYA